MDDRDVIVVENYINENFSRPSKDRYESYSRWAAEEILSRVIDEASKLPAHITGVQPRTLREVIQSFVDEMDYYADISGWNTSRIAFSVAREEGKYLMSSVCSN